LIGKRDPTDVDLLSLALKIKYPVWTLDRDFSKIQEIAVVTTDDLLALVKKISEKNS